MTGLGRIGGIGRTTGLVGLLIFAMLLFAAPITLRQMIPLATRAVASHYPQAAEAWRVETRNRSTHSYPGVLVDWREVIAFDAVRRNQDFRGVTYGDAYTVTQRFTRLRTWWEKICYTDAEGEEHCYEVEHRWYEQKFLEEVMQEAGFTDDQKAWAYDLLQKAYLLLEDGIECRYDQSSSAWTCNK